MKMFNLKKYFFSYIYIFLAFLFYYLAWRFLNLDLPPANHDDVLPEGFSEGLIVGYTFLIYLYIAGALVIEILIRKFIVEKYFPNLKFSINISLPEALDKLSSVIFYVLFAVASIPIVSSVIFTVVFYSQTLYEKYVQFLNSFFL